MTHVIPKDMLWRAYLKEINKPICSVILSEVCSWISGSCNVSILQHTRLYYDCATITTISRKIPSLQTETLYPSSNTHLPNSKQPLSAFCLRGCTQFWAFIWVCKCALVCFLLWFKKKKNDQTNLGRKAFTGPTDDSQSKGRQGRV